MALTLTACSGGGGDEDPARSLIAIVDGGGNVAIYDVVADILNPVTDDAGSTTVYTQPTWSPDGSLLAFVELFNAGDGGFVAGGTGTVAQGQAQLPGAATIHIVDAGGGPVMTAPTPFIPFYMYWSPDGEWLSFLGSSPPSIGLALLDLSTGSVGEVDNAQPYYYAWSPDSSQMFINAGGLPLYYLGTDGNRTQLETAPGNFTAPQWQGDALMYVSEPPGEQWIVLDKGDASNPRRVVPVTNAAVAGLSPAGDQIAFIDVQPNATPVNLGLLQLYSDGEVRDIGMGASSFFWSTDGTRLLYMTVTAVGGETFLQWNVWEDGTSTGFEPMLPSQTLFTQYLPFFSQYANSHSFFSPDATAFVYAGFDVDRRPGVYVQEIEGDRPARWIADGTFAVWAPASG